MKRILACLFLFFCGCAVPLEETPIEAPQAKPSYPEYSENDVRSILGQGRKLTPEQVQELEASLLLNPDQLEVHLQLLSYYRGPYMRLTKIESHRQAVLYHYLWLIENDPANPIFGRSFLDYRIDLMGDEAAQTKAAELWKEQVALHTEEPLVISNAAYFFYSKKDQDYTQMLLEQGASLEPFVPGWKLRLARVHLAKAYHGEPLTHDAEAAQALQEYEKVRALIIDEVGMIYLLPELTKAAFEAKEWDKAKSYAEEALAIAASCPKNWPCGDLLYDGNTILGRLALRSGDIEAAKSRLLNAGNTTGHGSYTSHPNMSLAKELLEVGEKEAVLYFLNQCALFWRLPPKELWQWIENLHNGETPDFGESLFY